MLIFAHIFAGALLGLGFWHLTKDRRAIVVCIAASVIPDLIDKSLGLLFPLVLGGGRTVFHSLGIFFIILIVTLMFVRSSFRLLGVGVASAILLHQIFDEMWNEPANWFYPLLGPFQGSMIPDYILTYFLLEITNPSEWLFMFGSVVILVKSYQCTTLIPLPFLSDRIKTGAYTFIVVAFGGIGLYLVAAGLTNPAGTLITPSYNQMTNVMAGLLALSGAVIMRWEKYDTSHRMMP
jgi:membrane-bound metal-dependent hydrolase YbcI (DUF457 family)